MEQVHRDRRPRPLKLGSKNCPKKSYEQSTITLRILVLLHRVIAKNMRSARQRPRARIRAISLFLACLAGSPSLSTAAAGTPPENVLRTGHPSLQDASGTDHPFPAGKVLRTDVSALGDISVSDERYRRRQVSVPPGSLAERRSTTSSGGTSSTSSSFFSVAEQAESSLLESARVVSSSRNSGFVEEGAEIDASLSPEQSDGGHPEESDKRSEMTGSTEVESTTRRTVDPRGDAFDLSAALSEDRSVPDSSQHQRRSAAATSSLLQSVEEDPHTSSGTTPEDAGRGGPPARRAPSPQIVAEGLAYLRAPQDPDLFVGRGRNRRSRPATPAELRAVMEEIDQAERVELSTLDQTALSFVERRVDDPVGPQGDDDGTEDDPDGDADDQDAEDERSSSLVEQQREESREDRRKKNRGRTAARVDHASGVHGTSAKESGDDFWLSGDSSADGTGLVQSSASSSLARRHSARLVQEGSSSSSTRTYAQAHSVRRDEVVLFRPTNCVQQKFLCGITPSICRVREDTFPTFDVWCMAIMVYLK